MEDNVEGHRDESMMRGFLDIPKNSAHVIEKQHADATIAFHFLPETRYQTFQSFSSLLTDRQRLLILDCNSNSHCDL